MTYQFIERPICPSCSSPRPVTAFRSAFADGSVGNLVREHYGVDPTSLDGAPYELMRCPDCTLVYQKFVGDDLLLTELYSEWINDFNLPESDFQYQAEVRRPLLSRDGHEILTAADVLGKPADKMTVLDFGMGWGLWARIAGQLGCESYGHELSQDRVDYARQHGVQPIADDDLGTPRFDFINTEQVMEHLRDLRSVTLRLAGSLKPGGILKISVPSGERAGAVIDDLRAGKALSFDDLVPVQPLEHVNCFTHRAIAVLARACGLEVVRPSLPRRYAFLKTGGTISLRDPRKTIKELIRPAHQYWRRDNLYAWLRKPSGEVAN